LTSAPSESIPAQAAPACPFDALARFDDERPIAAIVRGDRASIHPACGWQDVQPDALTPRGDGAFVGCVAYEIGHTLEPTSTAARPGLPGAGAHPDAAWGFGGWTSIGGGASLAADGPRSSYRLGPLRSAWGRHGYEHAVARAVELIHAGDVYQVNLTHALVGRFEGSTRALFADLARLASPAMGCYLELPPLANGRRRAILSLSPELLVRYDAATRTLTTEPMKGTRPATDAGLVDLKHAEKDKAELAMIVDLMRNDLGRVSDVGSVRVDESRMLVRHGPIDGGVWQASARVTGRLRDGVTLDDVLRAILPAGSITGAPKVRAMQVIHEMEPTPRGPYCGAIGVIDEHGNAELAVGIRTAVVVGNELRYSVGAGIVAQSNPAAEWAETLAKAGPLRAIGAIIEDDAS
jgi:para-aminobenzoate synthetase component 1